MEKKGDDSMLRTSKKATYLSFALILFILCTNVSWAGGNLSITPRPEAIRSDGESLVWMSYVSSNWDVYHMNVINGNITRITNDTNTQGYPDVWKNYIVWQGNKEREGGFDIYLYDIGTKTEKKISNVVGNHQDPRISKNKVVWVNDVEGSRRVMVYDIITETTTLLSSSGAQSFGLAFDGTTAAWMDSRNNVFNIYSASVDDQMEKQITFGISNEVDPLVSDGKIVWKVKHNNVDHVYMYDTTTGFTSRLTVGSESHTPLAFSGSSLLMTKGNQLILNSVDSITDSPIKSPTERIPDQSVINGNDILWIEGGRVMIESISQAIARAITVPQQPTTPQYNSGGSSGPINVIQNEEPGRRLIKAGIENIITFDDNRVTFVIPKGAFSQDTYLKLKIGEKYSRPGYNAVTNTYNWEFENGKPATPVELKISYDKTKIVENPKKIVAYKITNTPVPVEATRDYQKGEFTIRVSDNGGAALMIYNKSFIDMKNHWAAEVVDIISSQHIISGYADGTFKPDQDMTRAEFVKVLVSSLYIENSNISNKVFEDVTSNHWGYNYINTAQQRGWVMGHDGKFNPEATITRQEMITIMMRVYQDITGTSIKTMKSADLSLFADNIKIGEWAQEYMEKAVAMKLIQGYDNHLSPTSNATRGEAATVLYRYLEGLNRL